MPPMGYDEWERILLNHVNLNSITEIISGGAKGIDSYAKQFAARHKILIVEIIPVYAKYGRKAPLVRNFTIIQQADIVIAFPSNGSRGTHHAINEANQLNKPVIIINI